MGAQSLAPKLDVSGRGFPLARRPLMLATSAAALITLSLAALPFWPATGSASQKVRKSLSFFGPVTVARHQSFRLDAQYVFCQARACPESVNVTLKFLSPGGSSLNQSDASLKPDGSAALELKAGDVLSANETHATILGVIEVAVGGGKSETTLDDAGVSAAAYVLDEQSGRASLVLPVVRRECFGADQPRAAK
jgi:hypothetical protein